MLAIVVPQAFTDGVDVVKPVILAHAKGHPDVDSTHTDGLLPLLQCMQYVNHNPGVRLLMITVLHGDAVPNANHSLS